MPMRDPAEAFSATYAEARAKFLAAAGARGYAVESHVHPSARGAEGEPLAMDVATGGRGDADALLLITSGTHGVEGFCGSGCQVALLGDDAFAADVDVAGVAVALVHAITPYGFSHLRRTNEDNVDLNRNFALEPGGFDPAINRAYDKIAGFLNPARPLPAPLLARLAFAAGLLRHLLAPGPAVLRRAALLGQYRHPRGIYYGGTGLQPETAVMIERYRDCLDAYPHLVLLDMHTGYGPRWQMSVVCSPLEAGEPAALARRFGYPRVVKAGGDAFYAMQGDMIDCAYRLAAQVPGRRIFAASFEFGTLGDSLLAGIRSLRATVWENQARCHGAGPGMAAVVAREYGALFYPSDPAWRAKALADARRALEGILQAEGLLGAGPGAAGVGP